MADLFGVRVTGPLQAHARGFSEQLTELGYTRLSAADQLRLMVHLSRWLAAEGWYRGADAAAGGAVPAGAATRWLSQLAISPAAPLLAYLRGRGGARALPPAAEGPVSGWRDYRLYLRAERGLGPSTMRSYERDAGGSSRNTWYRRRPRRCLTPAEVTAFVFARPGWPWVAMNLVSPLRSLLRFVPAGHDAA